MNLRRLQFWKPRAPALPVSTASASHALSARAAPIPHTAALDHKLLLDFYTSREDLHAAYQRRFGATGGADRLSDQCLALESQYRAQATALDSVLPQMVVPAVGGIVAMEVAHLVVSKLPSSPHLNPDGAIFLSLITLAVSGLFGLFGSWTAKTILDEPKIPKWAYATIAASTLTLLATGSTLLAGAAAFVLPAVILARRIGTRVMLQRTAHEWDRLTAQLTTQQKEADTADHRLLFLREQLQADPTLKRQLLSKFLPARLNALMEETQTQALAEGNRMRGIGEDMVAIANSLATEEVKNATASALTAVLAQCSARMEELGAFYKKLDAIRISLKDGTHPLFEGLAVEDANATAAHVLAKYTGDVTAVTAARAAFNVRALAEVEALMATVRDLVLSSQTLLLPPAEAAAYEAGVLKHHADDPAEPELAHAAHVASTLHQFAGAADANAPAPAALLAAPTGAVVVDAEVVEASDGAARAAELA